MTYEAIILAAAKAAKVSGTLLLAICTHESGLNNVFVPHDGGSPSIGICQLKESTSDMLGHNYDKEQLMEPEINAKVAAEYLKWQQNRYGGDLVKMVSAYNAGTYRESKKVVGCPRNLRYVNSVKNKLKYNLQENLSCGKFKKKKSPWLHISVCMDWKECLSPLGN